MPDKLIYTFCILLPLHVMAAEGDELYILGDLVNIRGAPSTDAPVVMKLAKGRKIFEVQRAGEWVEIRTRQEDGKTGWINLSLVGNDIPAVSLRNRVGVKAEKKSDEYTPQSLDKESAFKAAFELFRPEFDEFNQTANSPFSNAEYLGNGAIKVMASAIWLLSSRVKQEEDLSGIFKIWSRAAGAESSISVDIVDPDDERLMFMVR